MFWLAKLLDKPVMQSFFKSTDLNGTVLLMFLAFQDYTKKEFLNFIDHLKKYSIKETLVYYVHFL